MNTEKSPNNQRDPREFPPDFLWGAATASYQIEGAAREDGRGISIWDTFSHTPGKVENGDTGDIACDHYHRYGEDIALMRQLGLKAYRFSIAWPRIIPDGSGALNPKGIDFYARLIDGLLEAGIEPLPTLYHWDLPQALEDAGGWPNLSTAERFAEYAEVCFRAFGDRVDRWITLNEPWCTAHLGYASGEHAPGRKDQALALQAGHTLLLAHGLAVQRFRSICPGKEIGITVNLAPAHPATASAEDRAAAKRWDAYQNRWFLDPIYKGEYPVELREGFGGALPSITDSQRAAIQSPIDFAGVNYYSRSILREDPANPFLHLGWAEEPGAERTAMGWEVYPKGLAETLTMLSDRYGEPDLYVTENGAAFEDAISEDGGCHDPARTAYLDAHFRAAHDAIEAGVRLRGYFVWSLLDNFEWAFGYTKRFGIIHVDYATQKRTPKDSACWYTGVIAGNGLSE